MYKNASNRLKSSATKATILLLTKCELSYDFACAGGLIYHPVAAATVADRQPNASVFKFGRRILLGACRHSVTYERRLVVVEQHAHDIVILARLNVRPF